MFRLLRFALLLASIALPSAAALAQPHGIKLDYMDRNTSPCRDFYRFANGAWLDTVQIPPAYPVTGAGRDIFDRNQAALFRVLERARTDAPTAKDPTLRKLGELYAALMDSIRADREGLAPIAADLAAIDGIRSRADLQTEMAKLSARGVPVPFNFGPYPDQKNSTRMIGKLDQSGLGLPERDYYFKTDGKADTLRRDYVAYVGRMLELAGTPAGQAAADADRVMKLETALAESSMRRVDMRDPDATYHKMSVRRLGEISPALSWTAFFDAVGVPSLAKPEAELDVSQPGFMRQVSALIEGRPLDDWKAYLRWRVIGRAAPWLGRDFFDESFRFQSKLSGTRQPMPRWKRAAAAVDNAMGEALGKAYVETEFPPSSKTRMLELVKNLQAALRERIESRAWMGDATKKQALGKLDAIVNKIGYPDKWRDYSALIVDPQGTAIANLRNAQVFERRRQFAMINKPVDRTEWFMSPPTVNAYYNPYYNEIVFPAGILQPPQFDPAADDAVNYGAIGMVIGHELTHGFDDEGRKFDAVGNRSDWWTDEDGKQFMARAQRVVEQYDGYVTVDTLHTNGQLTLGENIADLGGITIAYHAWQRSLRGKPRPPDSDGFTPEQRFFLGYAQAWRNKMRPEMMRLQTLTNEHSIPYWRVNGPLSNMQEFRAAFGCKEGDGMVRDAALTIEIW